MLENPRGSGALDGRFCVMPRTVIYSRQNSALYEES